MQIRGCVFIGLCKLYVRSDVIAVELSAVVSK